MASLNLHPPIHSKRSVPQGYSEQVHDETGWLPCIADGAVCTVAWVVEEAGVVPLVRLGLMQRLAKDPDVAGGTQNVPDTPA